MKVILFLFLLSGIFFSCQPQNDVKDNEEVDKNTRLLKYLMDVWETGDTLKNKEIFTENCEYTDIANNKSFSGIAEVNSYVGHVHNWASNTKMKIRKSNVCDKMGYVEWTFTAKQTNPITGRVPVATNKDITLNGVTVVEFKDGKIHKASDYMDVLGFVIQLGAKVELPGAKTIGE